MGQQHKAASARAPVRTGAVSMWAQPAHSPGRYRSTSRSCPAWRRSCQRSSGYRMPPRSTTYSSSSTCAHHTMVAALVRPRVMQSADKPCKHAASPHVPARVGVVWVVVGDGGHVPAVQLVLPDGAVAAGALVDGPVVSACMQGEQQGVLVVGADGPGCGVCSSRRRSARCRLQA